MAKYFQPNSGMPRSLMKPGDILINTSTFKPAHCGIVVEDHYVIHATSDGILMDYLDLWQNEAEIFRPTAELGKDELTKVTGIAREIKNSATYGMLRAGFKSTFSSGSVGTGLQKRLEKYRERLKNHQGVVKHVYCSELVILCYQLGFPTDRHRLFIDLDGKHTWPSTLRRYLKGTIHWTHLGELVPQANAGR